MPHRFFLTRLGAVAVFSVLAASVVHADTLIKVVSASSQGANDSLSWSQKGADGTVLGSSFSATTALSTAVTVGLTGPNSIISSVCAAAPCSWTGTGFTAGHRLLWTSDASNGGTGPVTLTFGKNIAGAGALIQADLPGAFTVQIQVYNGSTSLGSYTMASDNAGDPVYLGAIDQSGANITKVVFSLTACSSLCSDFGVDTVAVNAATASSTVTLTPGSLSFGTIAVGSTSASQTVTLKNTGGTSVSITSIASSGTDASSFIVHSNLCGSTLASGASCTFQVAFKPATSGALSAAVLVTDNASGSPQQVNVSGTGSGGTSGLTVSPSSLSFGSGFLGTTSPAQAVTLTNSGSSTVTLTSITLTGSNPTSFVDLSTCGSTLAASASCTVAVSFKPTTTGSLSASLSIAFSGSGSPQTVSLTGTASAQPTLTFSTSSMTFPTTLHGTTSPAQVLTISNTGTTSANLSLITLGGSAPTDFAQLNTCGPTLAAGSGCKVYVAFKPASSASYNASLIVYNNSTSGNHSTALTGTGN